MQEWSDSKVQILNSAPGSVLLNVSVLLVSIYKLRLIFTYFLKHFGIQNCLILICCFQAKFWQISFVLHSGMEVRLGWPDIPLSYWGSSGLLFTADTCCPPIQSTEQTWDICEQKWGPFSTLGAVSSVCPPYCFMHSNALGGHWGTCLPALLGKGHLPRPRGWRGWKVVNVAR